MPELASTTREQNHTHLFFLGDSGQSVSGTNNKHSHNAIFEPESQQWIIEPAEDGHTHDVIPYVPVIKNPPKKTDQEKADAALELYKYALQTEYTARKDAKESVGFYTGKKQWDDQTKQDLNAEKRSAITINEVAAKVDLLAGFQGQNRTDVSFAPIEEGDNRVAHLLDIVYKNIEDQNNFPHEERLAFLDEIVQGRGNLHVYVDYDKDVQGKIVIEKLDNDEVVYGPHQKFDLSDCEHLTKFKMFSKGHVEQKWPDKHKDINVMFTAVPDDEFDGAIIDNPGDQYATGVELDLVIGGSAATDILVDTVRKEIKIIENYAREYYTEFAITAPEEGFVQMIARLSETEAKKWAKVPGIRTIRRNRSFIRRTVVAGTIFIEETFTDDFDIIPVYAKKQGNYFYGKVEEVKDPQREINKRHSQAIDIVNKVASYNWIIDEMTFRDSKEEDDFLANSATPGYVIKVDDMNKSIPQKVDGIRVPTEIVAMMELSTNKLREIMNIPAEASGFSDREFSGVAMREKKHSVQVANEFLFANLNTAKRILARRVINKVQEIYDVDRILRLVNNSQPKSEEDQMENQINMNEAASLLQNADLMKYDVVTTESVNSPTTRTANFAVLMQLAQQGILTDPSLLIEASDIHNKDKMLGRLSEAAAASAEAEKNTSQSESFKSAPDELQIHLYNTGQSPLNTEQSVQLPPQPEETQQ